MSSPLLLSVLVEPKTTSDEKRLMTALVTLLQQDRALEVQTHPDTGVITLAFLGEEHMQHILARLEDEFHVELRVGGPHVLFRETIRKVAEAEGKYIRQTGGSGNYGHVKIRLEPNEPGNGFEFIDEIRGGVVPKEYIKPTEQGIREALHNGVLAGYEMVDFKAVLFDGSYHDVDSNEMAFKIAGSMAYKEAARKASPVLLEPVMAVEVTVPEEHMGTIIGDINSRRGRIEGMEHSGGSQVIKAMVPLKEMFGYVNDIHSSTQGRASCAIRFAGFEPYHGDHGPETSSSDVLVPNTPRSPKSPGSKSSVARISASDVPADEADFSPF